MESCGERLKFIRENLIHLSRSKFEQITGINRHTLRAWEDNVNPIDSKTADDFAAKVKKNFGLMISPQWLIFGTGTSPMSVQDSDIDLKITSDLLKKERIINELDEFRKNQGSIVTILKDDSMHPYLEPGDFVGGIICNLDEIVPNKLYIIKFGNQTLIRRIAKSDNDDIYLLEPFNREFHFTIVKGTEILEIAKIMFIRYQ